MEDSAYISFKQSLSSVPAKALGPSSRSKLSSNLNIEMACPAKNGNMRDYRGLAEFMGFEYNDIKEFQRHRDPTGKILESWEILPDAMLGSLIDYLKEMERSDVISKIFPLLEKDAKLYFERQKSQKDRTQVDEVTSCSENSHSENMSNKKFYTVQDVEKGECMYFDAFVSYADADYEEVLLLADDFEKAGLQLYIRERDMLGGCVELEANLEIMNSRSRLVLIVLTPNYIKSPACEFQISFADSMAIDQRQRRLITVLLKPCQIPLILKCICKIDFTEPRNSNRYHKKLICSIIRERVSEH